ncbi:flagellar protein FlaG [Helicobacter canis]|nr:flagellar protein FlaG [Helicobacter canis]
MVNSAGQAYKQDSIQASNMRAASSTHTHRDDMHTRGELVHTAKEINKKMEHIGADINFSYNDDIGGLVVTVKDPSNGGKVIREIPSKEAIELTKKMHEVVGLIFDKRG